MTHRKKNTRAVCVYTKTERERERSRERASCLCLVCKHTRKPPQPSFAFFDLLPFSSVGPKIIRYSNVDKTNSKSVREDSLYATRVRACVCLSL